MLSWLVRILLTVGAATTALFVAADAQNFTVIQGVVTMLLVVFAVATVAFWPAVWR